MSAPASSSLPKLRLSEWLMGLVLAALVFTLPQKPLLELDSSWRQALAYFLHRDYPFGESIIFTYGPLGFLMGNTYSGLFWEGYIIWQAAFSVIAATIIVYVARPLEGVSRFCYFAFFALWGVGYADALHMIIIAFCGWIMIQRLATERSPWPVPFRPKTACGHQTLGLLLLGVLGHLVGVRTVTVAMAGLRSELAGNQFWLSSGYGAAYP